MIKPIAAKEIVIKKVLPRFANIPNADPLFV